MTSFEKNSYQRQFQNCSNVYVKVTTDHTDYTDFSQIALPPRPTKTLKLLIIKRIQKKAGSI
ncbi:MAG: hypothetical protein IKS67_09825, partial [Victivallales bacterium]|nr:hypothetical protein [Victivallales bacterium]